MASSSQDPSSSSTSIHNFSFDVFLSFRGEDTRYSFTDHLFKNLSVTGINTFRDDQLERGEEINPKLLKTIEESRISIVVFSKNYADSMWCLDELAKIMECREERKQTVLPVFYYVDPSDVQKQTGSFGEAFSIHERNVEVKKVQRWRDSLTEAAYLSGFHVKDVSESDVIEKITNDIIIRLNRKSLYVGENIVGMNIRLEKLKSSIKNVLMVGIWGIGGVGKTTIAKALYNEISNQFQGASFLADVRETTLYHVGLLQLQQQLLDDIQMRKKWKLRNIHEGKNAIRIVLSKRRVLVVLDDVDNVAKLEWLVGNRDWFAKGSRILITTRNRGPLDSFGVDEIYEIEELNFEEALQLFSQYAFKQNFAQEDYKNLSVQMVRYASGLPLALKVLGSLLHGRTQQEWKSELRKLESEPIGEIHNVLKISFHGLDRTQREIFLDIACFFKRKDKYFVSRILDGCGFYADSGFKALYDRCLITILDNKIHMHDLIQEMGWHMVREQYPQEPGKWSRLWKLNDVSRVFNRKTGTEAIEGIFLDNPTSIKLPITTEAFKTMNKLRLLKVHQDAHYDSSFKALYLPWGRWLGNFEFPFQELRYLYWYGYPLESLPSNFYAESLVELNLQHSKIYQLWKTEPLENLKVINLSHSEHLNEIPNPSSVPNLEILTLKGCVNLESLPWNIYELRSLKTLCCTGCINLRSFPEIMGNMENLRELYLDCTAIVQLPSSMEHLKGLEYLTLAASDKLVTVPQSICNLSSLKSLNFSSCLKLEKLPEDLENLKCLEKLYLDGANCQLPSVSGLCSLRELFLSESNLTQGVIQSNNSLNSLKVLDLGRSKGIDKEILIRICHLSSLGELYLNNCDLMDGEIPSEVCQLSSLEVLDLSRNDFSSIPASISQLPKLKALGLSHCKMLRQIPELPSTLRLLDAHNISHRTSSSPLSFLPSSFSKFQDFKCTSSFEISFRESIYFGEGVSIVIPGICGIPEWIMDLKMGSHVTINLPQDLYEDKDFLGFALCSAYVPLDDKSVDASEDRLEDEELAFECELSFSGDPFSFLNFLCLASSCECYKNDGASGQVWVLYYPKVAIEEKYHSNKWRCLKASFHGYFRRRLMKVEKCGMRLIYAKNDSKRLPPIHNLYSRKRKRSVPSDSQENFG